MGIDWFMEYFKATPFGVVLGASIFVFAGFTLWRLAAIVRAVTDFEKHVKGQGGTDEKVNKAVGALSVLLKQSGK